jgi:hypothetical protein
MRRGLRDSHGTTSPHHHERDRDSVSTSETDSRKHTHKRTSSVPQREFNLFAINDNVCDVVLEHGRHVHLRSAMGKRQRGKARNCQSAIHRLIIPFRPTHTFVVCTHPDGPNSGGYTAPAPYKTPITRCVPPHRDRAAPPAPHGKRILQN